MTTKLEIPRLYRERLVYKLGKIYFLEDQYSGKELILRLKDEKVKIKGIIAMMEAEDNNLKEVVLESNIYKAIIQKLEEHNI